MQLLSICHWMRALSRKFNALQPGWKNRTVREPLEEEKSPVNIVCLDLEGVLVPEIWIDFAALTGIDALSATTRDVADYDELMRMRIDTLATHGLGLPDIQAVIDEMTPLAGARAFLDSLRTQYQVIILSDTFYEFAWPLMRQLNWPTLFCHQLETRDDGQITGYRLRMPDHKRAAVDALRALNFSVVAAGDSFNDTSMLAAAEQGVFFHAPDNVTEAFPQFPVTNDYDALAAAIAGGFARA